MAIIRRMGWTGATPASATARTAPTSEPDEGGILLGLGARLGEGGVTGAGQPLGAVVHVETHLVDEQRIADLGRGGLEDLADLVEPAHGDAEPLLGREAHRGAGVVLALADIGVEGPDVRSGTPLSRTTRPTAAIPFEAPVRAAATSCASWPMRRSRRTTSGVTDARPVPMTLTVRSGMTSNLTGQADVGPVS